MKNTTLKTKLFFFIILISTIARFQGSDNERKLDFDLNRNLQQFKTFKLFTKGGDVFAIDTNGKYEKLKYDEFSKNGELIYSITSENTATIVGNLSSIPVSFEKDATRVRFIEKTDSGNVHLLEIFNKWDKEEGGYFFIYRRGSFAESPASGVYSTYWGIAKPW